MRRKNRKPKLVLMMLTVVVSWSSSCAVGSSSHVEEGSLAAHQLQALERKHNLVRATTRQELSEKLETLIEFHPDLILEYQQLAQGSDLVIANIARYRLGQAHLELGCALEGVSRLHKQTHRLEHSGLEEMSQARLESSAIEFSRVHHTLLDTRERHTRQQKVFSNRTAAQPTKPLVWVPFRSTHTTRDDGTVVIACGDGHYEELPPRFDERLLFGISREREHVCAALEDEYLGHLKPFVY